jgi:hypothetical protein
VQATEKLTSLRGSSSFVAGFRALRTISGLETELDQRNEECRFNSYGAIENSWSYTSSRTPCPEQGWCRRRLVDGCGSSDAMGVRAVRTLLGIVSQFCSGRIQFCYSRIQFCFSRIRLFEFCYSRIQFGYSRIPVNGSTPAAPQSFES